MAAAAVGVALIVFAPRVFSRSPDAALPQVAKAAIRPVAPPPAVAAPGEKSIIGTLEKYDPASRELVLNTGKASLTFRITTDATVRQGSKRLKADELVAHRGDRLKLRYSEAAGQRRADWIMLAPAPRPPKNVKSEPPK
jgi:hypothetical protein